MPSTHLSLHYHVTFSTKQRVPMINESWRDRLHAYMGGVVRASGGAAEIISGVTDHVHLLIGLPATVRLADIIRDLKSTSSRWVHETIGIREFEWQEGYGAFTVSGSQVADVREYIANQAEHHRSRTFQEEYVAWLKRTRVAYDERYLC
jgi:REP element-mobilizing transposase RayT